MSNLCNYFSKINWLFWFLLLVATIFIGIIVVGINKSFFAILASNSMNDKNYVLLGIIILGIITIFFFYQRVCRLFLDNNDRINIKYQYIKKMEEDIINKRKLINDLSTKYGALKEGMNKLKKNYADSLIYQAQYLYDKGLINEAKKECLIALENYKEIIKTDFISSDDFPKSISFLLNLWNKIDNTEAKKQRDELNNLIKSSKLDKDKMKNIQNILNGLLLNSSETGRTEPSETEELSHPKREEPSHPKREELSHP